jgi:hypothetical protein
MSFSSEGIVLAGWQQKGIYVCTSLFQLKAATLSKPWRDSIPRLIAPVSRWQAETMPLGASF